MSLNFEKIFRDPLKFKYLMETEEDTFGRIQKTLAEKTHICEPATLKTIPSSFGYKLSWRNAFSHYSQSKSWITHICEPTTLKTISSSFSFNVSWGNAFSHYSQSKSWIDFFKDKITTPLLHLSLVSETFEIESDGTIVLNIRFGGCGEPSIYGATGKFDCTNVKIGYIKVQKEVNAEGQLILRNWDKTDITPGRVYTNRHIETLYSAFDSPNKFKCYTLDEKWKEIARQTELKSKCSYVDSQKIKSLKYLNILDHTMWFSESHNYEYNILSNNSKTFSSIFNDFLTKGDSKFEKAYAKYMKEIFSMYSDITFANIFKAPIIYKNLTESREDFFKLFQKILGEKCHIHQPATLKALASSIGFSLSSGTTSNQSYQSRSNTTPSNCNISNFFKDKIQTHILHLSIVSETFEIESDGTIVLNIRFGGYNEPSIYGIKSLFESNKNMKIGYIKVQKEVNDKGYLILRNWDKTNLTPGRVYSKDHIETLYSAFDCGNKFECYTLDDKWKEIARLTGKQAKSSLIDSQEIISLKYLNILDHTIWFSASYNVEYSLFTNNCQTFSLIFHDFLTKGDSEFDTPFAKYMKEIFRLSRDLPIDKKIK